VLLELVDIRASYGKLEALKGVSLGVEEGSIVTLLGANGAGKTTCMNVIMGVKRVDSGEVWFQDKRIDTTSIQDIVRMGIIQVPEGRRLFPMMTVLENLKVGAYLRKNSGEIGRDLDDILTHFPILKERSKQLAGSLSGGEQQMLAVARSLIAKPKLILFDEPTMGLSPVMVTEIARIISDINQTGVSIMLVEQNARLALRLATKGYVLETGKIVLEGPSSELLENPYLKEAYLGG
jgi:branched-chain amino acid transport system ATP-binding protein